MSTDTIGAITGLVLTYNEGPNIGRALEKLDRLPKVIVVDSGSDDGTIQLIAQHANAETVERKFDTHAQQWNFGLTSTGIDTEWVLALDADYILSDELVAEIEGLRPDGAVVGYRAQFTYCIEGKPIRSGTYPPVTVLFRRNRARYVQEGHTHRLTIEGRIEDLSAKIFHDDRKRLSRWLDSQKSYARLEAEHLEQASRRNLKWQDRIRLLIGVAPPLMFLYVYMLRGGILDGARGLFYALQRAYAELLLSLELLDRKLRRIAGR